uniref:Uncharacterized protein n=1 Tax=Parascaris univalens TaxID=6257 RepID=A0A915AGT2_PARUN
MPTEEIAVEVAAAIQVVEAAIRVVAAALVVVLVEVEVLMMVQKCEPMFRATWAHDKKQRPSSSITNLLSPSSNKKISLSSSIQLAEAHSHQQHRGSDVLVNSVILWTLRATLLMK